MGTVALVLPASNNSEKKNVVQERLASIAMEIGASVDTVLAMCIHSVIEQRRPISRLLQFVIDSSSEEFMSEEFYHRHPDLLQFLSLAGSDDEEVQFMAYVHSHSEIMRCKKRPCQGTLSGTCPIMTCDTCGTSYFLDIEHVSEKMCSRCSANKINECTAEFRRKRYLIPCVL